MSNHMGTPSGTWNMLGAMLFVALVAVKGFSQMTAPPVARQDGVKEVIHGVEIEDPYRWLEDQDSPETRSWIDAENAYSHSVLDKLPGRAGIHQRLIELMEHDTISSPSLRGDYYFFYRRAAGQDLWSLYRRKGIKGRDELVLDPHPLSPDHTTSILAFGISEDGNLLVYGVRAGGEDETTLHVMDMGKHRDLTDVLPRDAYTSVSWRNDLSGFYYGRKPRGEATRIYFHALGADANNDREIVFKNLGPQTWASLYVSSDGRYELIDSSKGWNYDELFVRRSGDTGEFQPIVTGLDGYFNFRFAGDFLIVVTDWEAPRGRILKIDLRDPRREKWQEIVPASDDAIDDFALCGGKLFVSYLHNVTSRIATFSLDGKRLQDLSLPPAVSAQIYGRYDQGEGIVSFSGFTLPYSSYRFSASTGKRALWYQDPVKIDQSRYVTEQVWYSSKDGTRVPMFLVHQPGLKPDGERPVLLYGYGGFSVNLTPGFNPIAAWWVEQGGIYALANIRGGSEFGEAWHKAGMLSKKQNVFDDFIAAAEWLIQNKYTNPRKLAIWGGSNGGLLVGAVTTQRPELFRAVICEHPDLDIVRYPKFTRNNITGAVLEYGDSTDPDQFKFVYAYSPYQHVKAGTKYPAILLTTGDADTRVPPEQARKMTARLQAATTSGLPILLLYDVKAGHSGGRPFSQIVDEDSMKLAFLSWQLGTK
jgi:prolyl oligopeptidase